MSNIVDRTVANDLIKKCREACEAIFKDAGFELVKVGGTFGDRLDIRLSAIPSAKDELGLNPNSPEVVNFKRYHNLYNISEEALGASFTVGKQTYKLCGINPNRTKFPLVVEDAAGQKKLLTTDPRVISAIALAIAKPEADVPTPQKKARAPK